MALSKKEKDWLKWIDLWIKEQECRIKECLITEKASRECAVQNILIAKLNQEQVKLHRKQTNAEIRKYNTWRKTKGLKPIKLR